MATLAIIRGIRLRSALRLVCVAALLLLTSEAAADRRPPSLVYVLLDTTRADRLGAWGHPEGTSPVLDALARRGVRFARHHATSHATRPAMPQLMTGRYYHDNILGPFLPDAHPREMSFAQADPSAILLPRLLARAGYATRGVSAHTWVAPDSAFGRAFDTFELLAFTAEEGHGDARDLVDRAIALWQSRDLARPTFLYVHFMDAHIPRRIPPGVSPDLLPGYAWQARFRPSSEPAFDRRRRAWSRYDASDFTAADRAYYAARYDASLRYADMHLGRLLAAIEHDDPGLVSTVVVVTADHGEELGEDGRIEHPASLADGVHRVPLVLAGGGIAPGQHCEGFTEHVDVVPTIVDVLGLRMPPGVVVDGVSWLHAGGVATPCGRRAAVYAWETYRAIRAGRYLLVQYPPDALATVCEGVERFYRLDGARRQDVDPRASRRRRSHMRRALVARLDTRERGYRNGRYRPPATRFLLRMEFVGLEDLGEVRCLIVSEETSRRLLLEPGWFWTGRGVALTAGAPKDLRVVLRLPDGRYRVEAATQPIPAPPWISGIGRWRRRAFRVEQPSAAVPLGSVEIRGGSGTVALPAALLRGHHVLGLWIVPPGADDRPQAPLGAEQAERLRALGYLQ